MPTWLGWELKGPEHRDDLPWGGTSIPQPMEGFMTRSTIFRISLGLICACHSDQNERASTSESDAAFTSEPYADGTNETGEFPQRCNPASAALRVSFTDEGGRVNHEVTVSCGQEGHEFVVTPEPNRGDAFLLRLGWSRFELSRSGAPYAVLELTNPAGLQFLDRKCGVVFVEDPSELVQRRCLIPEELVALDWVFIDYIADAFALDPGPPRGIDCCRPGVITDLQCACIPPDRISMPGV